MTLWMCMFVPVVATAVLMMKWPKAVNVWELSGMVAVCLVVVCLGKLTVMRSLTNDTEYWTGFGMSAEYLEDWNEHESCTHYDDDGNIEHPFGHVTEYPEEWWLKDANGLKVRIGSGEFESLCDRWGNRKFEDMNRWYHDDDGDKYVTTWDGDEGTAEVVTTVHVYENRVQASGGVFDFVEVSPVEVQDHGLYDYWHEKAAVGGIFAGLRAAFGSGEVSGRAAERCDDCRSVRGNGPKAAAANRYLDIANARVGPARQVRMFLLTFEGKLQVAGQMQEAYWDGGNKNEFVVCVGINGDDGFPWVHVFSWCEDEQLKVMVRQKILSLKQMDLLEVAKVVDREVSSSFQRKQFADFSYLSVTPSWGACMGVLLVTILVTVLYSLWAVNNRYDEGGNRLRSGMRMRRMRRSFRRCRW